MRIKQVLIIIFALILASFIGYRFGIAQIGSLKAVVEPGSMATESSYIIFTDGSTIYTRNGLTGEIEFSGTDASTVIQAAIDALTNSGGRIFVKAGYYDVGSSTISFDHGSTKTIELIGEGRRATYLTSSTTNNIIEIAT